jgi:putative DNA primase/helicase
LTPVNAVLERLQRVKKSRKGWTARCPSHDDNKNSLSICEGDEHRILLKCFAGCGIKDIVRALGLEMRDLFPKREPSQGRPSPRPHHGQQTRQRQKDRQPQHTQKPQPRPEPKQALWIDLKALAQDKRLPIDFLQSLGLKGDRGVLIPYRLVDGSLAPRQRLRTALKANDGFTWLSGIGSPVPYGLWRLGEARQAGYLILVEGESDCWTLWYHGFPALGVPGADMTGTLEAANVAAEPIWSGRTAVSDELPLRETAVMGLIRPIMGGISRATADEGEAPRGG